MNPLQLSIRNFMNHRKSDIELSNFNTALIVGKTKANDDISNGVGKSTIFSAIEWVLFNKVHKTTLETIVRDGATKCSVDFSFEVNNINYKIARSLSSKGTKNVYLYEMINDNWESITQRTPTETEAKIQDIIKISHKAFQYSVLFRQADLSGLAESENGSETNSKARIDILKEPMNLMRYSKKEKIISELMKPIKAEIAKRESAMDVLGDPEKDIITSNEALLSCRKLLIEKENLLKTDLQISLDEKTKSLNDLKSTLSSSDVDIHNKVEEQHKTVKKLNYSIKSLNDNITKTTALISSQNIQIKEKKIALKDALDIFSKLEAEQHRSINQIKTEYDKVVSDEMHGNRLLSRVEVELEHARKSIPNSDECPSCKQPITKEYRCTFEEDVNKVLIQKQTDIDFYKDALKKCIRKKNKLSTELENAKSHVTSLNNVTSKIDSLRENIKTYEDSIKTSEKSLKEFEIDMDAATTELQHAMTHYNTLKEMAEKSNLSDLNTKIFALAREIKVYEQSIESIRSEVQNLKTREGVLQERINTHTSDQKKLNELQNEVSKFRKDLSIHQRVTNAFSHKGIPTSIINTCLNELQLETNKVLQELRPDLEVQFDSELNFTYRRNGIVRNYHQLSHGQHVYIALSFKRGLAKVIQKKIGVDIRFLEFDEIDASLDAAGRQALVTAIKKWEKDFKILVITHNNEFKDKFSHAILVEEGDDGSEAKVVTHW